MRRRRTLVGLRPPALTCPFAISQTPYRGGLRHPAESVGPGLRQACISVRVPAAAIVRQLEITPAHDRDQNHCRRMRKGARMPRTKRAHDPKDLLEPWKCPTGIQGLDEITNGGLPKGRPTLVGGGCRMRQDGARDGVRPKGAHTTENWGSSWRSRRTPRNSPQTSPRSVTT